MTTDPNTPIQPTPSDADPTGTALALSIAEKLRAALAEASDTEVSIPDEVDEDAIAHTLAILLGHLPDDNDTDPADEPASPRGSEASRSPRRR